MFFGGFFMRFATLVISLYSLCLISQEKPKQEESQAHVDIVICIDQSGSMQQVIDSAKAKIWAIVNEFARAKPTPIIRVGLIAYEGEGERFNKFDLTDDLDEVYKNLMPIKTQGGNRECVGRALMTAVKEMSWSKSKQLLKVVFIAGNEPASQDSDQEKFGYKVSCEQAVKNDILINSIYCGDVELAKSEPEWQELARLGEGKYTRIDLSGGVVSIATPFDEELVKLSGRLNDTYIQYGKIGDAKKAEQTTQDKNAQGAGQSAAPERAMSKAQSFYRNAVWDLVDASREKEFDIEKIKEEDLPKEMKGMTKEEKLKYIEKKSKEREDIQKQIKELSEKRDSFMKEEIKKQGLDNSKGFDEVIKKTVTEQAEKKGYKFEK